MKMCSNCRQSKPLDEFHRFAAARDGRRAECKQCARERAKAYYRRKARDVGMLRLVCKHCGEQFEYEKTTGRRRFYCGEECRYQATEAAKKARAAVSIRRCACGSPDVAKVGKPVCLGCRKDKRDPAKARDKERRRTLRRYGITEADWDRMLAAQDNRCAICRTDKPCGRGDQWHVDHCHQSGRVRGLLCHGCNVALGHLDDDPRRFIAALMYLGAQIRGPITWWSSEGEDHAAQRPVRHEG